MARRSLFMVSVLVLVGLLVGCPTSRPVVSVSIDQGALVVLEVGESLTLSATVVVAGGAGDEVVWSASCGVVSGSGPVVLYSAPASASDCVVTVRSVADAGANADVVVLVRAVPEVMYDGAEPVAVEVNELGRVVVERSAGDRRFEVSVEDAAGAAAAGAVVSYEEYGSVALLRAVHPVGRGTAVHVHDLTSSVPGPSEVMEASDFGTTFGIVLGLVLAGAVWEQSRVLYAEVDVTLERVPATSAEDGVTEVCVSPEDFVYLLLTSAAAQEKEIEALQVLGLGVLMTAVTAGIHVPAVGVAGAVSDLGHLANALAEPLVEDLRTFARSALEVPGFGGDEYLEVTFLGFRHLPGVAGGATWSTAVITGAGCDPGAFVSETGTVEFTSSLEDVTPWGDAPVTVRIDPPAAYVDVYLYQSGRHGTSGEDYLRRFPPVQTDALGFAEFWVPFNGDGIRSLRAVVPERRVSATAEVSWALEAVRDMSPQLFNLQVVGHQGVIGERVTLRYRVGEADRLIGCEVDWREGGGWEAFDCPPRGVAGHSTEAVRAIEHVYSKTGLFRPTLRVRNSEGLVSQAYAVVSVTEPPVNSAPVIDSVTFDGGNLSWRFRDDDILDQHHCYFWQITPDRRFVWGDWACPRSGSALVSVPDPLAEFKLDVTDGFVMDRWRLSADINRAPQLTAFEALPSSVAVGDTVVLSWSVSDPDGDVLTCSLDVTGDGVPEYTLTGSACSGSRTQAHVYAASGEFVAEILVEDGRGGEATATAAVTVSEPVAVAVMVSPSSVTLPVNGTQSFTATVTGASDTSVTWGASCGSISGSGNTVSYTAPATAGECEVTATSVADSSKNATASVTVTDPGSGFEPAPSYITIDNVTLGGASGGTRRVGFDISWDESWRGPDRPLWVAARSLRAYAHRGVRGRSRVPGSIALTYRSGSGYGMFAADGVGLQWDYVADGVSAGASVEVVPFGIEMVFVPEGSFSLGSGGTGHAEFREGGTTNSPFVVASEASISLGDSSGQLMWTDSVVAGTPSGDTSAAFPTGFGASFVMKHQLTQGQYVDFLNTLTQAQADARKITTPPAYLRYRYAITGSSVGSYATSLPFVGMNWIDWADGAAFADWAGLRPLTELEFEKVARGPLAPVANEYAWGSTSITQATGLASAGTVAETPTPAGANAAYGNAPGVQGPARVGSQWGPPRAERSLACTGMAR